MRIVTIPGTDRTVAEFEKYVAPAVEPSRKSSRLSQLVDERNRFAFALEERRKALVEAQEGREKAERDTVAAETIAAAWKAEAEALATERDTIRATLDGVKRMALAGSRAFQFGELRTPEDVCTPTLFEVARVTLHLIAEEAAAATVQCAERKG